MALATLTSGVAGQIFTAALYNNNNNAILNQLNGNLDSTNLADGAVSTSKLASNAVTFAKMLSSGVYGPWTGAWTFDAAVDFNSTVDFTGATLLGAIPLIFEGATDNAFEISVAVTDPTVDRTFTIPNEDVNLGQQIIKGWAKWSTSGGAVTLDDSFNVSSIGDNAVGDFTVNWSTAFGNDDYAVAGAIKRDELGATSTSNAQGVILQNIASNPATTSVRITTNDNSGSTIDPTYVSLMAIGDR